MGSPRSDNDKGFTFSNLAVERLKVYDPRIQTRALHATLREIEAEYDVEPGQLTPFDRLIPDAFLWDREAEELTCYEVEDTSPLTLSRLRSYIDLHGDLDYYGVTLRLVVLDRYGLNPRELPLGDFGLILLANPHWTEG